MAQLVEVEARGEAEEPERTLPQKASSTTHKVGIHLKCSGRVFISEVAKLVHSLLSVDSKQNRKTSQTELGVCLSLVSL